MAAKKKNRSVTLAKTVQTKATAKRKASTTMANPRAAQVTLPTSLLIKLDLATATPRDRLAAVVARLIVEGDLDCAQALLDKERKSDDPRREAERVTRHAAESMREIARDASLIPAARVLEAVWLAVHTDKLDALHDADVWACELLNDSEPSRETIQLRRAITPKTIGSDEDNKSRPRLSEIRLPGPLRADVGRVLVSEIESNCGAAWIAWIHKRNPNETKPETLARNIAFVVSLIIKRNAPEATGSLTGAVDRAAVDKARTKIEQEWLAAWHRNKPLEARALARLGLRAFGLTSEQAGKYFNAATKRRARMRRRAR
ncbi:MAG: hypothetical protein ACHREM_29075 [Polyangiales bacterium]